MEKLHFELLTSADWVMLRVVSGRMKLLILVVGIFACIYALLDKVCDPRGDDGWQETF